jgi:hypothetical protein
MTSPIAAGGLVLDVAGALALASAFMLKLPRAWRQEATPPATPLSTRPQAPTAEGAVWRSDPLQRP